MSDKRVLSPNEGELSVASVNQSTNQATFIISLTYLHGSIKLRIVTDFYGNRIIV